VGVEICAPLHLIGAGQGSFLRGFLAWVLQHSDSVFRDSRICSSQLAGHTEAYAMLQDALWFALSLVWLCPLVAAIIFVFLH
jgi:hypothetical protein